MKENFWELENIDASDLAVAVAGDLCEGKIDPLGYITSADDIEKLNLLRFCLAVGCDENELRELGKSELDALSKNKCSSVFGTGEMSDIERQIILGGLFCQFDLGICGEYRISYDSLNGEYPKDREMLIKTLKEHFGVENFHSRKAYSINTVHSLKSTG